MTTNVGGIEIWKLFNDNGNFCDMFLKDFLKIGIIIKPINLKHCTRGLIGFTGYEATLAGMISLSLTLDEWLKATTEIVDFLFIGLLSAYNGIIGRPSQFLFSMVSSARH